VWVGQCAASVSRAKMPRPCGQNRYSLWPSSLEARIETGSGWFISRIGGQADSVRASAIGNPAALEGNCTQLSTATL
jgi:hypothetical protein